MLDIIQFLFYWIGQACTYLFTITVIPGVPLYTLIIVATVIVLLVRLVFMREED